MKYLNLPNIGLGWWRDNHYTFLTSWRRAYKYRNLRDDDLFPLKKHIKSPVVWGPQEWDVTSKKITSPSIVSLSNPQDINLESFRIYVNTKDFFMLSYKFPWSLSVEKIDFSNPKNKYCLALKTMYVLSYLTGIGLHNLKSDNPLAKSLAHFYFHYHIRKFYNFRDFANYDVSAVEKFPWSVYSWASHFVWYHPQIKYTADSLKYHKSDVIEKIHVKW